MNDHRPVICQLIHTLNVGGAEILAGNLARRLQHQFRFTFMCLDEAGPGSERLKAEGFPVEVLGRRPGLDLRCSLRLAAQMRQEGVALVQAHQYTPFFYALLARVRRRRVPIVFTEHGRHFPDFPRPKRKIVNRLLLGSRDRVVAVGRSVKQALIDNEGIPDRRIEVIPNGIDLKRFAPSTATRTQVRRELGIGPNDFLVLMVARLDPIKDHSTAIKACARAAASIPTLKLVIVGDGPERHAIERTVQDAQMGRCVQMLGTRHDVPRLLTGADTLLLTSVSEGLPLTVVEAMATGIPVVSTAVGSVAEVVVPSVGFLAPAGDVATIARHLVQLGQSPLLRIAMGDRARARAEAEFSEATMTSQYGGVFHTALSQA